MSEIHFLIALSVVSLCCAGTNAQTSSASKLQSVDDPIFGISFKPDAIRYDPIPAQVRELCPDFKRGQFWTFATLYSGGKDYYVVLGVRPGQDGDSLGAALQIGVSKCQVEDSTWMLSGVIPRSGYSRPASPGLLPGLGAPEVCPQGQAGDCYYALRSAAEEAVLRGLVKDAVGRAIKAYGSRTQFEKKACTPSQMAGSKSTPVVLQELERFCTKPN